MEAVLSQHNIAFEHYVLEELSTPERLAVKKGAFAAGMRSLPIFIEDGQYVSLDDVLAKNKKLG